ncbi:hypothetical protein JVU11DRAFT_3647 [Chiua virens]|nr:hypothetical protein JVU11DRAFT_3647 [Chiua virens]
MEPTNKTTVDQPQAAIQMSVTNPAPVNNQQVHAKRLRGGGAGKDCLLGALECFLCFGVYFDNRCSKTRLTELAQNAARTAASAVRTLSVARARCAARLTKNVDLCTML